MFASLLSHATKPLFCRFCASCLTLATCDNTLVLLILCNMSHCCNMRQNLQNRHSLHLSHHCHSSTPRKNVFVGVPPPQGGSRGPKNAKKWKKFSKIFSEKKCSEKKCSLLHFFFGRFCISSIFKRFFL